MAIEKIKIGLGQTLRDTVDQINAAIASAENADTNASEAKTTANTSLSNSESTQTQLDNIAVSGDSSVEAAQARVEADGTDHTTLKERLDTEHTEVSSQLAEITQDVDIVVTVGSTGDYATINKALEFLSRKRLKQGKTAEIRLLSGFMMSEQVHVNGINLGWIKITSVDASVVMDSASITENNINIPAYGLFDPIIVSAGFGGENNAVLPVIDVLFNMNDTVAGKYPFCVVTGAKLNIMTDKGCINAGATGLFAVEGGEINAPGANVSYAGGHAVAAWRGGSHISFSGGNGTYAGVSGVYLDGHCTAEVGGADFSYATDAGVICDNGSSMTAVGVIANNVGTIGIMVNYGATATVKNAQTDNAGDYGVRCYSALVDADGISAKNAGVAGILVSKSGIVNANGADVSGANTNGLFASEMGIINAREVIAQKVIGTDNSSDIKVATGGIINAILASGGITQRGNVVTSAGIIFNADEYDFKERFDSSQSLTLSNGWTGTLTVENRGGLLWLHGNVTSGTTTNNTTIATLPPELLTSVNTVFQGLHGSNGTQYGFHVVASSGKINLSQDVVTGMIAINALLMT